MSPNYLQLVRFSSPASMHGKAGSRPVRTTDEIFGALPEINTETTEDRVDSHLAFVDQLLRMRNPRHLSEAQRKNRRLMLDLLSLYATMGIYPRGYDQQPGDFICYRDAGGRFCPVGFLIERTGGRDLATALAALADHAAPGPELAHAFDAWLDSSGLSREELLSIHPDFPPAPINGSQVPAVPTPGVAGISRAFAGLQQATAARHGDYLASAFIGNARVRLKSVSTTVTPQLNATVSATAPVAGMGEAISPVFGHLTESLAMHQDKQRLRVFFISSKLGEPVLAITFSRSF